MTEVATQAVATALTLTRERYMTSTPSNTTKSFTMSFPQQLVNEPILYSISTKYGVVFNIVRANVSDAQGHLTLSLTAAPDQLDGAIRYLKDRGVNVQELPAPAGASH